MKLAGSNEYLSGGIIPASLYNPINKIMEKYRIIQLCDSMTEAQSEQVVKALNDGYFILADYKFTNTAFLILELEDNKGVSVEVTESDIKNACEKTIRRVCERNTSL